MKTKPCNFKRQGVLVFTLLLGCCSGIMSQVAGSRHYTSSNGLLSDRVYNIYSDLSGYLWFNSEFGTIKYNGETFNKVLKNLPLSESFVFCIYERDDGRKWFANSNANIYEIVNDSARKILGIEKLSEALKKSVSEIIQLVVDDDASIYLTTKFNSFKLELEGTHYKVINLSSEIKNDSICVKLIKVNAEWLPIMNRTQNDEYIWDKLVAQKYFGFSGIRKQVLVEDSLRRMNLRHFRELSGNIYYTNGTHLTKISSEGKLTEIEFGAHVINFKIDHRNHIWVGCQNAGVFEINEEDSIISHFLVGKTINDLAIDYQNGVWVSTNGYGVYRLEADVPPLLKALDASYPVIFGQKTGFGLLMANSNAEYVYKNNEFTTKFTGSKQEVPVASCIKDNKLILAYSQRIVQYDLLKIKRRKEDVLAEEIIAKCAKISEIKALGGDTLIAVWKKGLIMFSKNSEQESIDFGKKITKSVFHNDTVWMGTEEGLFFHPIRWKLLSKRVGEGNHPLMREAGNAGRAVYFKNKNIVALCFDRQGSIWVGTSAKEILVLQGSKLQALSAPPGEIINDISIDSEIIVSTNQGAFQLQGNIEDKAGISWEPILKGEVLKCIQVDGVAFFQTGSTMSFVQIKDLSKIGSSINFNWIGLTFDSVDARPRSNFLVRHSSKEIKFKFERIYYIGELPDIVYSLVGPVSSNGISKANEIIFSRLLPGNYTLTTFPNIFPNNAKKIEINFSVLPEWYETWWAVTLAFTLLLGIIAISTIVVVKRNRKKMQQKNEQEQLLLEYKLIALKAQVNPHFISNCLTAIQNLIAKGENEKANLYVAKFGLLVRKILDFSSMSLITLEEELQVVRLYIHMEEVRFGKVFEFNLIVQNEIDLNECMVPSLLLNPIVENAIWHGLLPLAKKQQAKLEISICKEEEALKITIVDNGVGVSEKREFDEGRKSYGLDITQQRIKNSNYLLQSTVGKVEIKNRHNQDGSVAGAEVSIWLPFENKY